jgi:hypothetical protein
VDSPGRGEPERRDPGQPPSIEVSEVSV